VKLLKIRGFNTIKASITLKINPIHVLSQLNTTYNGFMHLLQKELIPLTVYLNPKFRKTKKICGDESYRSTSKREQSLSKVDEVL